MALNDDDREAPKAESVSPPPEPARAAGEGRPAPLWVVPLYVLGFVAVYLGERVLEPHPIGRYVATFTGLGAVTAATIVRFMPRFRLGGERADIEKLLGVLSVLGLIALALYGVTTETGWQLTGLVRAAPETQERVRGVVTIGWVALVLMSLLPMLFAEAALLPMRHAERPEARRVRAAAVSAITLVLAAVYGALFVYSADKLSFKVDYSYFKTSRPSDSTRKIVESLSEPVDVVAFFPQVNEIKTEVASYLTELSRGVPNLRVEVQDRLLVPKRAKELKATQDGVIVIAKGTVTESLSIGIDDKNARPKLKTLDRDFQEKLLKIVRERRVAYLTVGHGELNDPSHGDEGERAVRIARTLLQKQNYLVKDLGLSQGLGSDVPDDASIVFVLGPGDPFAAEELAALGRYADRGGRLFIALDPESTQWAENAGEEVAGEPSAASPSGPPASAAPSAKPAASAAPSAKPAASAAPSAKPVASAAPSATPAASTRPVASAKPVSSAAPAGSASSAATPSVAPAPPPKEAPGLIALGRVAGVELSPAVLANEKQHVRRRFNDSDRTLLVTNRFSSHASVSTLSRNSARAAVVFFGSGSLERASGSTAKVDFTVKSAADTFADTNKNYKPDGDERKTTYNLAAAVSRPRTAEPLKKPQPKPDDNKDDKKKKDAGDETEMRAFVMADADALTDVVMANVVGNQVLFADAVRWLGGEESFSGEVNTEEDVRIEHTKQKDLVWFYATIFGAPALVLGLGLAYSRRLRRGKAGRK